MSSKEENFNENSSENEMSNEIKGEEDEVIAQSNEDSEGEIIDDQEIEDDEIIENEDRAENSASKSSQKRKEIEERKKLNHGKKQSRTSKFTVNQPNQYEFYRLEDKETRDKREKAVEEYLKRPRPQKPKMKNYVELIDNATLKTKIKPIDFNNQNPFDERSNDEFLSKLLEKERKTEGKKLSEGRMKAVYDRFKDYKKGVENKVKELKVAKEEKIKEECSFQPKVISKGEGKRNPAQFLKDQLDYNQRVKEKIEAKRKEKIDNEIKESSIKVIDKNSEMIAESKNAGQTREDIIAKLAESKKNYAELNEEKSYNNKPSVRLTEEEIENNVRRLTKERSEIREKNKKLKEEKDKNERALKEYRAGDVTNKMFFEKFAGAFIESLRKLKEKINADSKENNEQNDQNTKNVDENNNIKLSFEQYVELLKDLGWAKEKQGEEALIRESFCKYLNPENNTISSYSFLVFALAAIGVYKGNDNKTDNITTLIKGRFKDFDNEKFALTEKQASLIRQKYISFYDNWFSNYTNKRVSKQIKEAKESFKLKVNKEIKPASARNGHKFKFNKKN